MDTKNSNDQPFIVRESALINSLFSIFFFGLFFAALYTIYSSGASTRVYQYIFLSILIPATIFLVNAIKRKVTLEVNNTGIYYYNNLITSWPHFVSANIIQAEGSGVRGDDSILVVEYYVPEKGMDYIIRLKLSQTEDCSEEQIQSAISHFLNLYQS